MQRSHPSRQVQGIQRFPGRIRIARHRGKLRPTAVRSLRFRQLAGRSLDADISSICARYGGGGHPVVGGIAFASAELDRARAVAREIAEELAGA